MYKRYRYPSIWSDMNRMQREMDKLFKYYSPQRTPKSVGYPPINIWADEENALITAEIPGVAKEDLDINVTGDTLTISGERKSEEQPEETLFHRQERAFGNFNRSIQLPYTVDVNKVSASFKNGLLEITLPRVEAEKPKKIKIKA
jgi:HSP20 family protein